MKPQAVLDFWFNLKPEQHFIVDTKLDKLINTKFLSYHQSAVKGELYKWRKTAIGRLAEIIVLDQFSRNIYRGDPRAFSSDSIALILAQEGISLGLDLKIPKTKRSFFYMPFMHSESAIIHAQALKIFKAFGVENLLEYEIKHKVIIDRFGHYPHRNKILGRKSTKEEVKFLTQADSSF